MIAVLAASGGVLMLLALPLSVLPQAQALALGAIRSVNPGSMTNPWGLNPLEIMLLGMTVQGFSGGTSLVIARDAFRSRLESGFGLVLLAVVGFVSVSTFYAGWPGFFSGVLLLTAGLLAEKSS